MPTPFFPMTAVIGVNEIGTSEVFHSLPSVMSFNTRKFLILMPSILAMAADSLIYCDAENSITLSLTRSYRRNTVESRWDAFLLTVFVEDKVREVLIISNVACDKDQIIRERSGRNYEI